MRAIINNQDKTYLSTLSKMKQNDGKHPFEKNLEHIEPLITLNDGNNFIQYGAHDEPAKLLRQKLVKLLPLTVIDKETLQMIQVLRLHQAVDHTRSATGSAVLLRSLIRPSADLNHIQSKQDALREIASRDNLRQALQDVVHEFGRGESALYKFFNKGIYALFPYLDVKRARQAAVTVTRILPTMPETESSYLTGLIQRLRVYRGSTVDQMMRGAVCKTFTGLKSDKEVGFFTPKLTFIPRRFSKWAFAGPAAAAAPYLQNMAGVGPPLSPVLSVIGLAWTASYIFYSLFIKPVRDTGNFIEPFRAKCVRDKAFSRAVDAVGMIDELLSMHDYARTSPHATALPKVTDQDRHFFEATGLKNPVIAKENADFVSNAVSMNGARLTFISGPNSGGKTTICKSVVHNQLLAQAGSYVLAESAAINIADMIRYQAPKFDGLQDAEGRFGTELARTRDIFYAAGPKSLVILDELAEGTTYEERLEHAYGILSDFHVIGGNTVLVTHNHSLIDRFMDEKKGQSLMVAFNGDHPTYRIIPGISRVSHADRIARKIRFSGEDRHQHLKEKGYV